MIDDTAIANRPSDERVAAARAGRVVAEQAPRSPKQQHGRPQRGRAPPADDGTDTAFGLAEDAKLRALLERALARSADDDGDDCDAYSIPSFCRRHGISRSLFFKLKQQGLGPRTMRLGARVLIPREAAAEWREKHTVTD